MSFDLAGFDFISRFGIYGFWVCCVTNGEDEKRSLLCFHFAEGKIRIECLWTRIK